jgi:hypothetical protein
VRPAAVRPPISPSRDARTLFMRQKKIATRLRSVPNRCVTDCDLCEFYHRPC